MAMANMYLVPDDDDYLTFHTPLILRVLAMSLVIVLGFMLFAPGVAVLPVIRNIIAMRAYDYTLNPCDSGLLFLYPIFALIPGFALWMMLYFVAPFRLRFDLRSGTYELRDGCFPLRRTRHGTVDDFKEIHVYGQRYGGNLTYRVMLHWQRGWRSQVPTCLNWTEDRWEAFQECWEFSRKTGVPHGDPVIYPL